jgi:ligand-binding sensor domain-containing protein
MKFAACLFALSGLFLQGQARAESPNVCFFQKSARLADLVTLSHRHVELFENQLAVDGSLVHPCNGLPADHPVAIARYREGFAVAFRDGGIHAWDGHEFQALDGLPSAQIRSMTSAGDALFIGTVDQGLFRYERGSSRRVGEGRIDRSVTALFADGGTVHVGADPGGWWIVTDGVDVRRKQRGALVGCFRKSDKGIAALPPGPACHGEVEAGTLPSGNVAALAAHEGRTVVGTFDGGVFGIDDVGRAQIIPGAPRNVNALLATDDRLFIGATSGLYVARGKSVDRVSLDLPAPHVNGLAMSRDGTLWMATSFGLVGWSNGRSRVIDERRGLPSSIVYAVAETADGALWAGTARGAARISGEHVDVFNTDNGKVPHDWITALLADGDGVDAGTYDAGVVHLGPRGESAPIGSLEKAWINPNGLARLKGDYLVATMGDGLLARSGRRFEHLPSSDVTATLEQGGHVWIGTRAGLARFDR